MKKRLAQMEAESAGVKEAASNGTPAQNSDSNGVATSSSPGGTAPPSDQPADAPTGPAHLSLNPDSTADADGRSIYVGNVRWSHAFWNMGSYVLDRSFRHAHFFVVSDIISVFC